MKYAVAIAFTLFILPSLTNLSLTEQTVELLLALSSLLIILDFSFKRLLCLAPGCLFFTILFIVFGVKLEMSALFLTKGIISCGKELALLRFI